MKKLVLLFAVFAVVAFAQRGGGGHFSAPPMQQQHYSAPPVQGWSRFGQPGGYRPMPVRPPVVIVRPGYGGYGGYGWNYYFGLGFWPFYSPYNIYGPYGIVTTPANQSLPCKKESLRDSNGTKHDILLCVQSDGSMKVVADANTMVAVPKEEVKK